MTGFPAQHGQSLEPVDSAFRSRFSFQSGMWWGGGTREERMGEGHGVDVSTGRWGLCGERAGASGLGAGRGSVFHPDDKHASISSVIWW